MSARKPRSDARLLSPEPLHRASETPPRKPRSDARLLSLPREQQEQIARWLTADNKSYEMVRKLAQKELGVTTSVGALHNFFTVFARPWSYRRSASEAEEFAKILSASGKMEEVTLGRAKQLAFELLMDRNPNVGAAKQLMKLVGDSLKVDLAAKKLELDGRRVSLLEQKAAQADAAKKITQDPELTDEEKAAEMRALFGMGG